MRVKVCGMRSPQNIQAVAQLEIDWMGFIFYERSPRAIADDTPAETLQLPSERRIRRVGVFVDASAERILSTCRRYGLDVVQLHGHESPELCHTLQKRGYGVIKALPIDNDPADLAATIAYEGRVDYFLFDTRCASYGGSGQAFDWSLLERYEGETPFLLSGGLRPESLDAIKAFHHPRLAGIDLNSGFESAPGIKDDQLLRTFIKQLKQQTL